MNSIRETIEATITAEINEDALTTYGPAITTVTEALLEREYQIADHLIRVASTELDYSEETARDFIEQQVGLSVRPLPEPVVEEPAVADGEPVEEDRFARLESTVNTLAATVANLAALAQRHLGASL